jgi:putative membrane protein
MQEENGFLKRRATRWLGLGLAVCFAAAVPIACGDDDDDDKDKNSGPDAGAPAPPITNDSQVVRAMQAANSGEIQLAELAISKNPHPDVREFADRMVTEHTAANERLDKLVTDLMLQPAESNVSQDLESEVAGMDQSLQNAASFDLAYMNSQVTLHTDILNALNAELIPKAQDLRLRLELINQRMEVENHLAVAQAIVTQLTGELPPPDAGGTPDTGGNPAP